MYVDTKPLRPYLIRAVYDWIVFNHFTPFLNVDPNIESDKLKAPLPFFNMKGGLIIFDISPNIVDNLKVAEWSVSFDIAMERIPMHVFVPIQSTIAIYAKENSTGLILPHEDWDAHSQDIISYINPSFKAKPKLSVIERT